VSTRVLPSQCRRSQRAVDGGCGAQRSAAGREDGLGHRHESTGTREGQALAEREGAEPLGGGGSGAAVAEAAAGSADGSECSSN
jgi:hypothetical protein